MRGRGAPLNLIDDLRAVHRAIRDGLYQRKARTPDSTTFGDWLSRAFHSSCQNADTAQLSNFGQRYRRPYWVTCITGVRRTLVNGLTGIFPIEDAVNAFEIAGNRNKSLKAQIEF